MSKFFGRLRKTSETLYILRPDPHVIDYQAPEPSASDYAEPAVTLHDDRIRTFETKKTPSLKNFDSFEPDLDAGIVPKKDDKKEEKSAAEPSKPAIVFRKRKINPDHRKVARRPGDDD